jgi:hypothetical protein
MSTIFPRPETDPCARALIPRWGAGLDSSVAMGRRVVAENRVKDPTGNTISLGQAAGSGERDSNM